LVALRLLALGWEAAGSPTEKAAVIAVSTASPRRTRVAEEAPSLEAEPARTGSAVRAEAREAGRLGAGLRGIGMTVLNP
jgi:hypothetical protein